MAAVSDLSTSVFYSACKWEIIILIIQVDRQCFLLIQIALRFIWLIFCCWWCFTLICVTGFKVETWGVEAAVLCSPKQELGRVGFWMTPWGVCSCWFVLGSSFQLESWNSLRWSVWSLHMVLSLILLHRNRWFFQVFCIWVWFVVKKCHYMLQNVSRGLFMYASINEEAV